MSDPAWKQELRAWVDVYVPGLSEDQDEALGALVPHVEAAYERGYMAGRSRDGYQSRRTKKKEEPWTTGTAGAGSPTPASITEGSP